MPETVTCLFKRLKTGKIQMWSIDIEVGEDGLPTIFRESQLLPDGKVKSTRTKVKVGKNIGKSNEQTPLDQAIFRRDNYIKEKIEDNMVRDIKDVDLPPTYIYAELAKGFREDKVPDVCYVQPKYNGVRTTYLNHFGELKFLSRKLKECPALSHIKKAIDELFPKGVNVDGEAYLHGLSLQGISSLSKKYRKVASKPEHRGYCSEDLKFYIFDLAIPDKTFEERQEILDKYLPVGAKHPILERVPTFKCENIEEYKEFKSEFISMGYEGIMSRDGLATYGFNERDYTLMKDKDFVDSEFLIVDYTYEEWYNEETKEFDKLVIWICQTEGGVRFNSRPLGSFKDRAEAYKTADTQIDKWLTIKYQDLSDDGVPNFNNGVCIRDYE